MTFLTVVDLLYEIEVIKTVSHLRSFAFLKNRHKLLGHLFDHCNIKEISMNLLGWKK